MAGNQHQQPLFGLLPAGHPLITQPSSTPTPTSFLYAIPSSTPQNPRPFAHLAVFLLPGAALPPDAAAAIYVATNPGAIAAGTEEPNFRFLGGVGPGKESAVFKLSGGGDGVVIGVSLEEAGSVGQRVEELQAQAQSNSGGSSAAASQQLVKVGGAEQYGQPSTLVLAQRIIKNAFNFLAGFSGQAGQVEVVPLRAFEEWWKKFEGRLRSDPTFLEKEQD